MDQERKNELREAILALVPADGTTIGNKSLMEDIRAHGLEVADEEYHSVKNEMVGEGLLGRGRGRGGSVYRTDEPEQSPGSSQKPSTSSDSTPEAGGEQAETRPRETAASPAGPYGTYQHDTQTASRPDVGVQEQFNVRRKPKTYRYDSSLAPELAWDENAEREFAEWLLGLVSEATEKGEEAVFQEEQVWKGTGERFASLRQCVARLRSLTQPFLNWAGKAERQEVSVPTVPLFIHERHSTENILETLDSHRASGTTLDLFGDQREKDVADQLDAYTHTEDWNNRLILGDSLQVMNSLLEYEGLGGQVQMIYMDPPYGVQFGSNFQPFVRRRDMSGKHGKDDWMIREPEMVKAYRDTWELGLHSYLSYLRDRLLLSKGLLKDSGSIFVQISDDNLHHVREILDEVFGEKNFISLITFKKTGGFSTNRISNVSDYLMWYAKDKERLKYNPIYTYQAEPPVDDPNYVWLEFDDGTVRRMTPAEKQRKDPIPEAARVFRYGPLTSDGSSKEPQPFEYEGSKHFPGANSHWKTTLDGMSNLARKGFIIKSGKKGIAYKLLWSNFPAHQLNNVWLDTQSGGFNDPKTYVVQTTNKTVQRCILMTTNPGDIVLDPTCGSGTTAHMAEQWGRRWITCDTSRVPLALARQRFLTATYPWYELEDPGRGPVGGFAYRQKQNRKGEEVGGLVPRITLKSIANDEEPQMAKLVDRPEINKKITRVCGPFTVEATIQAAHSLEVQDATQSAEEDAGYDARTYLDRMIEVVRRARNLNLPGNRTLKLEGVRPVDSENIYAEATDEKDQRIAILFGPEDGAINSQQVFDAASEAHFLKYQQLFIFGFAIQAKARELVENHKRLRLPCTYISVTPDVVMDDLLKTSHTDQLFSITGLPDAMLKKAESREDGTPRYRVELVGLDTFLPHEMKTESVDAENLPCWMLDTNYNGMSFCASQVFFPRTKAWDNLQKSLRAQFDDSVWDHLAGTESEPFGIGDSGQVAVKVIDERGNELMRVLSTSEAKE